jgi:hypothetical protein
MAIRSGNLFGDDTKDNLAATRLLPLSNLVVRWRADTRPIKPDFCFRHQEIHRQLWRRANSFLVGETG